MVQANIRTEENKREDNTVGDIRTEAEKKEDNTVIKQALDEAMQQADDAYERLNNDKRHDLVDRSSTETTDI